MSRSLPSRPNLHFLQEEAKDLLKSQRFGDASACPTLRLLHRFADASNEGILAAHVSLTEAQFALAMDYGFASWAEMHRYLQSRLSPDAVSLDAVQLKSREDIPEYAGGVPLGIVAALNHAGTDIDYIDFAAATGWAFSFAYTYDDLGPAFLAVQGNPQADGVYEVFGFLPPRLGYGYLTARTDDHPALWDFVRRHVDAGTPVISEHLDGGIITEYREENAKRQFYYDATAGSGWLDADSLQPYAVYVLRKEGEGLPQDQLINEALLRAVEKGNPREEGGLPHGLLALETYYNDVGDPAKDFGEFRDCWFCWATFERLMSRKCAAAWLQSVAKEVPQGARGHILDAARQYGQAFDAYETFRVEVMAGEPSGISLQDRARTPERIAVIAPILRRGIDAEQRGHVALQLAVDAI